MTNNFSLKISVVLAIFAIIVTPGPSVGQTADYDNAMERGLDARRDGDFSNAEEFFSKALAAREDDVAALRLLALMMAFQDRLGEARIYIERAVARAPDDVDVLISYARILSWQEDFPEAENIINTVITKTPNYAEAWTLKGRIAYYRQNLGESEQSFEKARSLDPGNLDALLGLGDVARSRNQIKEARRYFEQAQTLYPLDNEVLERFAQLDQNKELAWRIDVDADVSRLTRTALSDWSVQTVRLERRLNASTALFGTVALEERFDKNDVAFQLGISSKVSDILTVYGDASITPAPDFLTKWQVGAGGSLRLIEDGSILGPGLLTIDGRHRRYDIGSIYTVDIGWQQYTADGRTWVWGKLLNTIDAQNKHLTGWTLSAWRSVTEKLALRAGLSDAPESDRGIVVSTRSYTLGIEYEIKQHIFLRTGYEYHQRENSYRRHVIRVGAGLRF